MVISNDGNSLGVMDKREALNLAKEKNMDLVVLAEKANPPVAKILDYSKFLYEEQKKQQSNRTKKTQLKEMKIRPTISEGDLITKANKSEKLIKDGNMVRFTVQLRGREASFPEVAISKLKFVEERLANVAKIEGNIENKNNRITVIFIKK
jgi:translation initiation factor IF-3